MADAETYARLAKDFAELLVHMRAMNEVRPDTYKASELAVFERVAAGERVPPVEVLHAHEMVRMTTLGVRDACTANGRWDVETAWAFRFGQPKGQPH